MTALPPGPDGEHRVTRGCSLAIRVALGAWLAWAVGLAVVAPEISRFCALTTLGIAAATAWRPSWGLVTAVAVIPAGALYAAAPARAAELFAWVFLASWLLALWRPLSNGTWPRAIAMPASLFGAALVASWLSLTVAGAAGIPWTAMPAALFQALSRDYLIFSAPAPETWTLLQSLTGLGLFLASVGVTRPDSRRASSSNSPTPVVARSAADRISESDRTYSSLVRDRASAWLEDAWIIAKGVRISCAASARKER